MIRVAAEDDLDWLVRADADLFGADRWSETIWRSCLGQTLISPGEGYLVGRCVAETADLDRIGVLSHARRRGVGSRLLEAAVARHPQARWLLEVRSDNASAIEFYATHGFVQIDRRTHYYADGADALVMQR